MRKPQSQWEMPCRGFIMEHPSTMVVCLVLLSYEFDDDDDDEHKSSSTVLSRTVSTMGVVRPMPFGT